MKRLLSHFYHIIAYIHDRTLAFSLSKCRIRIGNVLNWLIIVIKTYSRNPVDLWMMKRLFTIKLWSLEDRDLFSDIVGLPSRIRVSAHSATRHWLPLSGLQGRRQTETSTLLSTTNIVTDCYSCFSSSPIPTAVGHKCTTQLYMPLV